MFTVVTENHDGEIVKLCERRSLRLAREFVASQPSIIVHWIIDNSTGEIH